ncbi:MAG: phosphotransferase [Nocardioides sp.]|uniref:maltokinase N-terminal cap-like domain-containing protein n=1 Tax=Nocardioides sp. TaxID=35761 RepID=UPI0039E44871
MTGLDPTVFADTFAGYLHRTRWFGGKGREFAVTAISSLGEVPGGTQDEAGDDPVVVIYLVEVTYADPAVEPAGRPDTELYQVPLALYEHAEPRLDHAFVGWWEDPERGWVHAYDALHDRAAMAHWLRSFAATAPQGPGGPATAEPGTGEPGTGAGAPAPTTDAVLRFHRLPGHDLDVEVHSTLFAGEQSNSSVAFGDDSLMKVFRKVTPGVNPDIAIGAALTEAGDPYVAPLYGWLDAVPPGEDPEGGAMIQLAMLQAFLRTATDGWEFALASVRTLFAEPEQHAAGSGGDFAGEATRLGEALTEIHRTLAERFPTDRYGAAGAADLAAAMSRRLEAALPVVPALAEHAATLRALFAQVAGLSEIEVQRVHGDLHLGQTLRTSVGWKIVDFEGEPAKPLAERLRPDSRWRDVAGMLRSFEYVPQAVLRGLVAGAEDEQLRLRAAEWANRNRNFFLVAYAGGELDETDRILLDAYVADKAVYECVYEARNRPTWLDIPLAALARIGDTR